MDMRDMTCAEELEVINYDRRHYPRNEKINRTRFYKYLTRNGDDIEIRTVAVKNGVKHNERKKTYVKEVFRASVDTERMWVRDMAFYRMANYMVDWSREGLSKSYEWSADGWFGLLYRASSSMWKMGDKPIVNLKMLKETDRFKWCAYTETCGDILDFLKIYAKHPRVELLVKAGLTHLASKVSFAEHMDSDGTFRKFVMDNLDSINTMRYGVDIINMAYSKKISLSEAMRNIADRRHFNGHKLPKEVNASKALAYMDTQEDAWTWAYCQYLRDCKMIGMNLSDTKVTFPKNFKARRDEIAALKREFERQKYSEKRKEIDKAIGRMALNMARLENVKGPFAVVLPKKEADLKREGKSLKHCVGQGSYAEKIAKGGLVIAFIRRKRSRSSSFVTVSFNLKSRKIEQCYGLKNSKPEKRVMDFINGPFERTAKKIKVG